MLSRKKLTGFILLIILILGIFIWQKINATDKTIKTTTVKKGEIVKLVSASGKVASEEEVELKFQTSGLLTWVGVKEGDHVNAWQAIAQLDTRELQKNLEKALRDYSKERNDWDEDIKVTYKDKALTDTAKRILEKNNWDLDKAVMDVELKDIALKLATLITPISGIITQVDTPLAGINITPATAVFEVTNPDKMIFKANVDEADIGNITASLSAHITLDAYPEEEFSGFVSKIAFASVPTSGGGTAYPVEINLPENNRLKFKLGMNGDTDIEVESKQNVLVIPSDAVVKKDNDYFVWLVKKGKAIEQKIKVGLVTDDQIEVLEGLNKNDKIVVSPISKIKEGQTIQ